MSSELVYKRMFDQACEDRALLVKAGKSKDEDLVRFGAVIRNLRRENTELKNKLRNNHE